MLSPYSCLHPPKRSEGRRDAASEIEFVTCPRNSNIQGGSRMQESRTYGSVRGARTNTRPYRDPYL
jgi:hypothetical protein